MGILLYIYPCIVDSKAYLQNLPIDEPAAESQAKSNDDKMTLLIQGENNGDSDAAATEQTTKKTKKDAERKKKEARIAAANKIAESIFSADCVKCKALTQELSGMKSELERAEWKLEGKERELKEREVQLSKAAEKVSDLTSSLQAKKRVIDTLESQQAKRVKSSG